MSDDDMESYEEEDSLVEDEDDDEVDKDSSSSETKRLRAQYGDPRRRSSRTSSKVASAKISRAKAPAAGKKGGKRKQEDEYEDEEDDEDDEMEEDEEEVRPRGGGGRSRAKVAARARPQRVRKQVVTNNDDELAEYLGEDDDDDDDDGKRGKKSRRGKEESFSEDLDDLNIAGGAEDDEEERRAETILDRREDASGNREYYVKWVNKSFLHCSWVGEAELLKPKGGKNRLQKFNTKFDRNGGRGDEDVIPADYLEVERILDGRTNGKETEYLVKWQSLGYEYCTWENAKDVNDDLALKRFKLWNTYSASSSKAKDKERPDPASWKKYDKSPKYENDNVLRDYQLEGLNWLTFNWYHRRNTILADEMGLGKTVQAMSMINHLFTREEITGPFLIVAPLSTIPHWKREFEGWTTMNAVVYHGTAVARERIRKFEFYHRNQQRKAVTSAVKFNVLITTYEMILSDSKVLKQFKWKYLIVDEAHRLKNQDSKLIGALRDYKYDHVLLMTGTPLQNNTTELWSLLNFLNPAKYDSLSDFLSQYGDLTTSTQVDKLHSLLRPIMLRRMKEDVEKSIAPLEETIVEVELTNLQKRYYRAIYERNFAYLAQGRKGNVPSLLNVVMQLRKCCNHPFLLQGVEDQIVQEESCVSYDDKMHVLIKAAGKLVLVDKLLPRLKEQGHKVLIFSQFARVLDILQDYLDFRKYEYERIDGSVRGNDRQAAIDRFSREGSTKFVFLLCTRAGGVGINLTAADTVIIFDSDWNPQNDVQAQARCHRIGQTQMVKVYRLITRGTYEKDMFVRASKKLGLDQAVLNKIEGANAKSKEKDFAPSALKKEEIDSLLRHGAYDVFREGKDKPDVEYDEADIERILERDGLKVQYSGPKQDAFTSLSKAAFVSSTADNQIDMEDPDFWKKLLPEHAQRFVDPNIVEGSRNRRSVRRLTGANDDDLAELDEGLDGGPLSEDEEYAERQAENRAEKVPDTWQDWSMSSRARFRSALLAFGFGRWDEIKRVGKLKTSEAQIQAYAEAMVEQMCRVVEDADVAGRFDIINNSGADRYMSLVEATTKAAIRAYQDKRNAEILAQASSYNAPTKTEGVKEEQQPQQPAEPAEKVLLPEEEVKAAMKKVSNYQNHWTLQGEAWEAFLKRNSSVILMKLMLVSVLGSHARKYGGDPNQMPDLGMNRPSNAPWWDSKMDNKLIAAIFKHGAGRYDEMWKDAELNLREMPSGAVPVKQDSSDQQLQGENADADLEQEDEDGDAPAAPAAPAAPEEGSAAAATTDGTPVIMGWEQLGVQFLNERSRRVMRALLLQLDKEERSKLREKKPKRKSTKPAGASTPGGAGGEAAGGEKKKQVENEWSKREKADFYRVLSNYGVPVHAPLPGQTSKDEGGSKIDWTYVAKEAILRKSPAMIEKYYRAVIKFCELTTMEALLVKQAGPMPQGDAALKLEEQIAALKAQIPPEVDLSPKQVSRLLQRLRLFQKLRVYVLPKGVDVLHEYFLANSRKSALKGLPAWWTRNHDVALIQAVEKHGYFWEDMLKDESLPFIHIWRSQGGSEEAEKAEAEAKKAAKKERKKTGTSAAASTPTATSTPTPVEGGGEGGAEDDAGVAAAGGEEEEVGGGGKKKTVERGFRRDRGGRCALVNWPKDGVILKRIEGCIEEVARDDVEPIVVPVAQPKKPRAKKAEKESLKEEDAADDDEVFRAKPAGKKKKRSTSSIKAEKAERAASASAGSTASLAPRFVKFDEQGQPIFPVQISISSHVLSLGSIVYDRPAFHSDKYIWPVGYKSTRQYTSTQDMYRKVTYTCEIIDGGDRPLFKISAEDMETPVVQNTASSAWLEVINRANLRAAQAGQQKQLSSVSGPEYFGYANPFISRLIQELPNADKLPNYKVEPFKEKPSARAKRNPKKRRSQEIEPEDEDMWRLEPKNEEIVEEQDDYAAAAAAAPAWAPTFKGSLDVVMQSTSATANEEPAAPAAGVPSDSVNEHGKRGLEQEDVGQDDGANKVARVDE